MEHEIWSAPDEHERQRRLAEMIEDQGPNWFVAYAPGSFGCHELLDRTHVIGDWLEQQVLSHPACLANPEWYSLADKAVAAVRELYQLIGASHIGADPIPTEMEEAALATSRSRE